MSELITVQTKQGTVSFLSGTRVIAVAGRVLGIKGFNIFGEVFQDAGFEEVAALLWAGHENACFFKKTDMMYETSEHIYEFIDEVGLEKAMGVMTEVLMGAVGQTKDVKKKVSAGK